jgi:hypothetical protein
MSLKKDSLSVASEHPTGVKVIHAGEGGPQKITCPNHKLACSPRDTGTGRVWICPRGCKVGSSRMSS